MAISIRRSSSMASRDLPEEIVAEILERLPVKSLLRFEIVSKTWLSLILNTQFMKSHIRRALDPTILIIDWIVCEEQTQPDVQLNEMVLHSSDSPVCFGPIVMPKILLDFVVASCCNGIICLCNRMDRNVIYLWNPLLKHYKKLPVPERRHVSVFGTRVFSILIGFGYDSISNDYKVLRFKKENDNDPIVQLYSSNADSWREFTDPILTHWKHYPRAHVVVNGVMYFDGSFELQGGLSFDLHKEVFEQVSIPSFAEQKVSLFLDFEGSVAMVFCCSDDDNDESTLCTLDTVSGTWTKKFRLKANLLLDLYLGAGQFFGVQCSEFRSRLCTVTYDYEKKKVYQLRVSRNNSSRVLKYTESLVSFKGFTEVE